MRNLYPSDFFVKLSKISFGMFQDCFCITDFLQEYQDVLGIEETEP